MRFFLFFLFVMSYFSLDAQSCFWQQAVDYTMNIDFDVKTNQYDGVQVAEYTNNSPDTLTRMYYHLYFNAFQPGSMMDTRSLNILDPDPRVGDRISKLSPDEIGFQKITKLTQNGKELEFSVVETILVVELAEPILPGETHVMKMEHKAQVPLQIRRSGRDSKEGVEYTMTQWYPKICEYDSDGWHPNQYVGREFYGVWGDYSVNILIDENYIIGAGGALLNPDEIGYGYGGMSAKGVKSKRADRKLLWKWKVENVHDFAWAADPDYIHTTKKLDSGVMLHFLYKDDEELKENWELLPDLMAKSLPFVEKIAGKYPYPSYAFIQGGDGGMEYPLCTMITGKRSLQSLVGVSLHELLHSWYQLILGTDEAQYSWMDEGFTSYVADMTSDYLKETEALGKLPDGYLPFSRLMMRYVGFGESPYEEPMSTHSDYYNTNAAYGVASYVKGAAYLHALRGIVGEEAFSRILHTYYNEWKFKHPTPSDFIRVAEKESGLVLNWYQNLMVYTTKKADYAVDTIISKGGKDYIQFARLGEMPMPIDVLITNSAGDTHFANIPLLSMYGKKPLPNMYDSESYGKPWAWTSPEYLLEVPEGFGNVEQVIIDPYYMLPDADVMNNVYPRVEVEEVIETE